MQWQAEITRLTTQLSIVEGSLTHQNANSVNAEGNITAALSINQSLQTRLQRPRQERAAAAGVAVAVAAAAAAAAVPLRWVPLRGGEGGGGRWGGGWAGGWGQMGGVAPTPPDPQPTGPDGPTLRGQGGMGRRAGGHPLHCPPPARPRNPRNGGGWHSCCCCRCCCPANFCCPGPLWNICGASFVVGMSTCCVILSQVVKI